MTDMLDRLAEQLGIAASYRDQEGRLQIVSESTKRALVSAFGIRSDDARAIAKALADLQRGAGRGLLEPGTVIREDHRPYHVRLAVPRAWQNGHVTWTLSREGGAPETRQGALADLPSADADRPEAAVHERRLLLPDDVPPGYHGLEVRISGEGEDAAARSCVIIAPRRAFQPSAIAHGGRLWGLAIQLYGLRSPRNWGIGDFTDLRDLMTWAGRIGAAAIGTNPLHALFLDDPGHISPYSPSSRHFINPLYLDVEAIEEFTVCEEARDLVRSDWFQAKLAHARSAPLVDYRAVTDLKRAVLERLHHCLHTRTGIDADKRRAALVQFRRERGDSLQRFAVFQALREDMGARDHAMRDWRRWPPAFRDPASAETAAFASSHEREVEFFAYLQWQADIQLSSCVETGRRARLPIGLYLDLAVGTDAAGADAWAAPNLVANGATIGAPPDNWNRKGQNWGLPPLNAAALRAHAFKPFAELLRANMRHAGAIRIDHALGLRRLFWIPEGGRATDGAYVAYPFEELIGIVALESNRNRCLVVGEDLGTLPEGFQAAMRDAGLLSYCLLYFERDGSGRFKSPGEYPVDALVSVSTHDLPTVWGFWSRRDLDEKERVGAYPDAGYAKAARRARVEEIDGLIAALLHERLVRPGHARDVVPLEAILRFIARTPSRLLMVGIEDLLGVEDQANLPGTLDEHPNWRRRLPMDIAAIIEDGRVAAAARILTAERPPANAP
jgi:4-alpha-glucanotransferase